jgi:hypothetical protein
MLELHLRNLSLGHHFICNHKEWWRVSIPDALWVEIGLCVGFLVFEPSHGRWLTEHSCNKTHSFGASFFSQNIMELIRLVAETLISRFCVLPWESWTKCGVGDGGRRGVMVVLGCCKKKGLSQVGEGSSYELSDVMWCDVMWCDVMIVCSAKVVLKDDDS